MAPNFVAGFCFCFFFVCLLRVPGFIPGLGCVFLDPDTSSDTSEGESYLPGEAAELSEHGEEVGDVMPLQLRFVVVVHGCR